MNLWFLLGEICFFALALFFLLFLFFSILEREKRALVRSGLAFIFVILLNFIFLMAKTPLKNYLFGAFFILIASSISWLFLSPLNKDSIEISGEQKKIDERDAIFSRFEYLEGTEIFDDYYRRRPEYKEIDDEIRKIPDFYTPLHIKKSPWYFSLAAAECDFYRHLVAKVDGEESKKKFEFGVSENTRKIKNIINI